MRNRVLVLMASIAALFAAFAPTARAGSSTSSSGNFHVSCTLSHEANQDPIVFPGIQVTPHLHDFYGNTTTGFASTISSMASSATTCDNLSDHSGYWSPSLIAPNGTVVHPVSTSVYYLARQGGGPVTAPPVDLRMIAGGDTRNLRASGYACGEGGATSSVPLDCGSADLKGVITFPSCWDGIHTDSPDHRSHLAYPTGKGCPSGYPVVIPKIVLHIRYGIQNGTGYYLASDAMMGVTNGMSLHADVWSVWSPTAIAGLVQNCLNAGVTC